MGAGARAAAMGDAFSAIADDVTATYWNPAGLGQIETPQMSLMQNSALIDTQYQYLAAAMPFRGKGLGISLYRLDHGSIDRYTANDVRDGSYQAGSMAASSRTSLSRVFHFAYLLPPMPSARSAETTQTVMSVEVTESIEEAQRLTTTQQKITLPFSGQIQATSCKKRR